MICSKRAMAMLSDLFQLPKHFLLKELDIFLGVKKSWTPITRFGWYVFEFHQFRKGQLHSNNFSPVDRKALWNVFVVSHSSSSLAYCNCRSRSFPQNVIFQLSYESLKCHSFIHSYKIDKVDKMRCESIFKTMCSDVSSISVMYPWFEKRVLMNKWWFYIKNSIKIYLVKMNHNFFNFTWNLNILCSFYNCLISEQICIFIIIFVFIIISWSVHRAKSIHIKVSHTFQYSSRCSWPRF